MLSRRLVAVKNTLSISWAVHEITSCFGYQKKPSANSKRAEKYFIEHASCHLSRYVGGVSAVLSLWTIRRCSPSCHSCYRSVFRPAVGGSGPAVYKASNYYQFPDRWEEFVRRLLSMCLRHACAQVDHGNMKSLGLFGICASWYASLRGETGSNWFLAQELNLLLKAHEACDLTVYSARNTARILLPSALRLFGGRIT